jgi:uncharacterized protein YyaL (SSP411 family)
MLFRNYVNSPLPKRLYSAAIAIAGLCSLGGCGKKGDDVEMMPELTATAGVNLAKMNSLGGLPGIVYSESASSPIHWQPWVKESKEMARESRRLMLVVIALPQFPSHSNILGRLASDPNIVAEINRSYVPVLVDGDAVREIGLVTADLCTEIVSGLQLPLLVWMTPDCNPVAWIPLPSDEPGTLGELFNQSHGMVSSMWIEDSQYVSQNSRLDQGNRAERMKKRSAERKISADPAADSLRALRQLTSFYDPSSRSYDEAGGLFPSGSIDLLSMGARMEGIPDDLREKCSETLGMLLDDLLVSAMFDPLDGGVFSSRRGSTWSLPGFDRDCATQARIAISLLDASEVTGNKRALEQALAILGFLEKNHRTQDGLYSLEGGVSGDAKNWMWLYEDVGGLLSPEEQAVWFFASGMQVAGNLPAEEDPQREFLRANTISLAKTSEQVAEALGTNLEATQEMLTKVREKLLKVRNSRLKPASENRSGNAAATFRAVSAYATAFRITGDEGFRERAVSTLAKAKVAFSDGPRLKSYATDAPASLIAGRAFVYGLAIQAALDVAAVTLDEEWILWAGDISSTASEIFIHEETLRECPSYADLCGLPVADFAMLFDESSVGLLSMANSRLNAHGIPMIPSFGMRVDGLPLDSVTTPIPHTDLIQAALMRQFGTTYVVGDKAPEEMKLAIARSPLKWVNRRAAATMASQGATPDPEGALLIGPGKNMRRIGSVDDLPVPSLP